MAANAWLDRNRAVQQITWAPGEPMLIKNKLVSDGGWIDRPGCAVFNLYRPPSVVPRAGDVEPWLNLIRKVFPDQAEHIVLWLAHRVQRPHEKINHALVLGGKLIVSDVDLTVERHWVSGSTVLAAWHASWIARADGRGVRVAGFMTAEVADDGRISRFHEWRLTAPGGSKPDLPALHGEALAGPPGGRPQTEIEHADGSITPLWADDWRRLRPGDASLIDRCSGPTLDVGSGPWRLTVALAERGVPALGIDVAPHAVRIARSAGSLTLLRDVFGRVPGTGRWRTVLLADGSIGIGGDPAALLERSQRVAKVLNGCGSM